MKNWFKTYFILILVILFSFSTLGARYLIGGQTFGERYPSVSAEGLQVWLQQSDVRSYFDGTTWTNLMGSGQPNVDQQTGANRPDAYATYIDFNGTTDFLQNPEVDDETGITAHQLATVATGARYKATGLDISQYATESGNRQYRIVFNEKAWAYAGGADSAEAKAAAKTLTAISKANPGVVDCVGHGYSIGDVVYFSGLTEMTSLNTKYKTITASADADHFTIHDTSAETAAETTGGACVQKLTSFGTTAVKLYNAVSGGAQSLVGNTGIDPNAITTIEVYKVIGDDNLTGDITVLMWVKPDDGQPAANQVIFSRHLDTATGTGSIAFILLTTGNLRVLASGDGSTYCLQTTDAAVYANGAQSGFSAVGFVYNGTTIAIYVNGLAVASTLTIAAVPASIYDLYEPAMIGVSNGGGYFNGLIADVKIFNRALSAAQVNRNYQRMHKRWYLDG